MPLWGLSVWPGMDGSWQGSLAPKTASPRVDALLPLLIFLGTSSFAWIVWLYLPERSAHRPSRLSKPGWTWIKEIGNCLHSRQDFVNFLLGELTEMVQNQTRRWARGYQLPYCVNCGWDVMAEWQDFAKKKSHTNSFSNNETANCNSSSCN